MNNSTFKSTNDRVIRDVLKNDLINNHKHDQHTRIIEELGIIHGIARVDLAVVNGFLHGYELKSDLDTLYRLPEQMKYYNLVFDQITLVVGKNHVLDAIKLVPDWWGIIIAKVVDQNSLVAFCNIRDAGDNPEVDSFAIAQFLWREEALNILERINKAKGVRSKPRKIIYERLAKELDKNLLKSEVRRCLLTRLNSKFVTQQKLSGDLCQPLTNL